MDESSNSLRALESRSESEAKRKREFASSRKDPESRVIIEVLFHGFQGLETSHEAKLGNSSSVETEKIEIKDSK